MDANTIRSCINKNWVFRLYLNERIPYFALVFIFPLLFLLFGFFFSFVLGVFPVFASNLLAYSGPVGMVIALGAYGWYATVFPKMLVSLRPALNTSDDHFMEIVKKWSNRLANEPWLILFFGLVIGIVTLKDTVTLWTNSDLVWIGQSWVQSGQHIFLGIYYGIFSVIASGFLLGSGIAGILYTIILLNAILKLPLKLDLYRRLRAIGTISLGVSFWTLMAFAAVLISSFVFKTNVLPELKAISIALTLMASLALLLILLAPILAATNAISTAKSQALETYESRLYEITQRIEANLTSTLGLQQASGQPDQVLLSMEVLDRLRKERDDIRQEIAVIEAIPSWPINISGTIQIIGAGVSPIFSLFLEKIFSNIKFPF